MKREVREERFFFKVPGLSSDIELNGVDDVGCLYRGGGGGGGEPSVVFCWIFQS